MSEMILFNIIKNYGLWIFLPTLIIGMIIAEIRMVMRREGLLGSVFRIRSFGEFVVENVMAFMIMLIFICVVTIILSLLIMLFITYLIPTLLGLLGIGVVGGLKYYIYKKFIE